MRKALLFIAASIVFAPFIAKAAPVIDVEDNNSAAMAQDIDGSFDLTFNALIGDDNNVNTSEDFPHAEIKGAAELPVSDGTTYDWYSFTITTPGSVGIFDIDCATQNEVDECEASGLFTTFDSFLELFDIDGTRLTETTGGDDDGIYVFAVTDPEDSNFGMTPEDLARQDPGSSASFDAWRDSFLVYTFDNPGTYFIRVGSFAGYADPADFRSSFSQEVLGDYLLHVSIIVDDDDGDGVVNDFDLCPDTPPDQAVDPAGCPVEGTLESIGDEIDALISSANKKARKKLEKAAKKLDEAQDKMARGDVKGGLKKLKNVVKELDKARKEGADTSGLIAQLVEFARAKAQAAIAMGGDSKDIDKAIKEMEKGEKELRKGKPDKAIDHFAKAYEKATKDDDDDSSDDDSSDD